MTYLYLYFNITYGAMVVVVAVQTKVLHDTGSNLDLGRTIFSFT